MFVVCFHISKLCMPISVDINGNNMNGNIKNIHNIYAAFGMLYVVHEYNTGIKSNTQSSDKPLKFQ